MLTDKELQHIAHLTRITLTKKEAERFKKELSSILDFVNKLNELDTEKKEPLYQASGVVNAKRKDEYRKDFEINEDLDEKLTGQAPHKENRFIKVRSVLKK